MRLFGTRSLYEEMLDYTSDMHMKHSNHGNPGANVDSEFIDVLARYYRKNSVVRAHINGYSYINTTIHKITNNSYTGSARRKLAMDVRKAVGVNPVSPSIFGNAEKKKEVAMERGEDIGLLLDAYRKRIIEKTGRLPGSAEIAN